MYPPYTVSSIVCFAVIVRRGCSLQGKINKRALCPKVSWNQLAGSPSARGNWHWMQTAGWPRTLAALVSSWCWHGWWVHVRKDTGLTGPSGGSMSALYIPRRVIRTGPAVGHITAGHWQQLRKVVTCQNLDRHNLDRQNLDRAPSTEHKCMNVSNLTCIIYY